MYPLMFYSQKNDPNIIVPIFNFETAQVVNRFKYNLFDLIFVFLGFCHCGPVVVGRIQVIPVHFVNSHCEHLLQFRIDPLFYNPWVKEAIDVDGSSVTVVEDEGMSEWLSLDVEGFIAGKHVEDLFVYFVCLGEVVLERLFDVWVGGEHGFRTEALVHGLWFLHNGWGQKQDM